jgi:hypothetical protein
MKNGWFALLVGLLLSCNRIEAGSALSRADTAFIRSLGLLDNEETIQRFYSNYTRRTAGSFFTDKRMAHYWLGSRDQREDQREDAFYPDITAVTPVLKVPYFDSPYLQVRRQDGTTFRVYMGGSPAEMHRFCQEALGAWHQHRHDTC